MELAGLSSEPAYLGIEIGELAAWVAVACDNAKLEQRWRARFPGPPSPDVFFQRLIEGIHAIRGSNAVAGIGIASWAALDSKRGVMLTTTSTSEWAAVSIIARLHEALGAPVMARAGVDAAALAEARRGAGRDVTPLIYVHLGREVLSALVYDGVPALGAHGQAGQIGHWRIAEEGPRCACGAVGHLNPLCSSQGIVRLAIGLAAQDEQALAAVNEATGRRAESLTASHVVALANAGIEPLRALVMRAADALGLALAQLSLVVRPEAIMLGGPLGTAGGLFMEQARERLEREMRALPSLGEAPRLMSASLEPHGALTGAWLLGHEAAMGEESLR